MTLAEAIQSDFAFDRHDGAAVFTKQYDKKWTMGTAPHGGFVLCTIIAACEQRQKRHDSPHTDVTYLNAFFFAPTPTGEAVVEIIVTLKRATKRFSYLSVQLIVRDTRALLMEVELIFSVLPGFPDASLERSHRTLVAPMPGARRTPFRTRSADIKPGPQHPLSNYQDQMHWRHVPVVAARTKDYLKGQADKDTLHGIRACTYVELVDPTPLQHNQLAMFLDMSTPIPDILAETTGDTTRYWHPTVAFTANFFCKLPDWSERPEFQGNEVGIHEYGSFLRDGRHETLTEVWTAPSHDSNDSDWRSQQQCLATATQMALTLPMKAQKPKL